jgi:Asp-tRNA(Asn)/Glu-tRNA(Gln) amidotransferase A subunit family amidase
MNPNQLGAAEAARLIAARKLTSESLVASCLERIKARDAEVKAWTCCDPEFALRQARALDRAARPLGPLHGVPIGFKDVLDTVDLPTEYGSPIYRGFRPRWDAACVALARAAGAVLLGKCATTEFANNHPAPTRNPHNLAHTPGGSSSGSAAAVADCMVPAAFGTQTGGSTIRPAAYCGIVGYKPTFSLINRAGLKFVAESLDTIGLYGRNVEDVALLAHAVSGLESPSFAEPPPAAPRIGLQRTPRWDQADAAAQSALESAARALAKAGAQVRDLDLPADFNELYEEHTAIMGFEEAQAFAYEYSRHAPLLSDTLRGRIEEGKRTSRADYESAMRHARACRDRVDRTFAEIDFALTLSAPGEAPRGLTSTGSSLFNRTWTLLGVPCINVPYGTGPNRLPLGVQLIGAAGSDATILRWAHWAYGALR